MAVPMGPATKLVPRILTPMHLDWLGPLQWVELRIPGANKSGSWDVGQVTTRRNFKGYVTTCSIEISPNPVPRGNSSARFP